MMCPKCKKEMECEMGLFCKKTRFFCFNESCEFFGRKVESIDPGFWGC